MKGTVLILGATGNAGSHCSKAFENDGWHVKHYNRNDDMIKAAQGVDVIINALNPPKYQNWAENVPKITKQVIEAAKASCATVIIPGNVYVYGKGGEWSETPPQDAKTRKGKIRIEMERVYRLAASEGVQTIILRAGDFINPKGGDVMDMFYLNKLNKGKVTHLGDPNAAHVYCYLPDFARAAVELANKRHLLDKFEDIPFSGYNFSVTTLRDFIEKELGKKVKLVAFPWWVIRLLAPVWTLGKELLEMRYLWSMSHTLSKEKFDRLLPDFQPTPLKDVFREAIVYSMNISTQTKR